MLASRPARYFPARRLRQGPVDESLRYFELFLAWACHDDWTALDGCSYFRHRSDPHPA